MDLLGNTLDISKKAGELLMDYFKVNLDANRKKDGSLVTEADLASHQLFKKFYASKFPEHHLLSEEGDQTTLIRPGLNWVIDPLDGTSNFYHGVPYFCTSVACIHKKDDGDEDIVLGVVYNPATGEVFKAEKGKGAYLGDEKLTVSKNERISEGFLACGYSVHKDAEDGYGGSFQIMREAESTRKMGSIALDLAKTGQGVFDLFFDSRAKAWDLAAASLIVLESGGIVENFPTGLVKEPFSVTKKGIIAGNRAIVGNVRDYFHLP